MGNRTKWSYIFIVSLGLSAFSFFISFSFPVRLIAFGFLLGVVLLIARNLPSSKPFRIFIGNKINSRLFIAGVLVGVLTGIVLAFLLRYHFNIHRYPLFIGSFVFVAGFIGIIEELIFRGFIQGYLSTSSRWLAIITTSLSHTAYKCCLFIVPQPLHPINILNLAFFTFLGGLIFGILKEYFRNVTPPAIAHFIFDIIVYADYVSAPWWVW